MEHSTVLSSAIVIVEKRSEEPHCYLFDLPQELRNVIYEEVLVHRSVLTIHPRGDPAVEAIDEWGVNFRPSEPSLLKTCRQIRQEALPIFYGCNIFKDAGYDPCCFKFMEWLTPEKRLMLKCVQVAWQYYEISGKAHYCSGITGCVMKAQQVQDKVMLWLQQKRVSRFLTGRYMSW